MAKKRANGEGSIRKKPNGRWEGRYTQGIDPSTGRTIQKSVSARTQAECKEKLAKAIRDNRGIPVNHNEDYTVAEWCRLWFETYSKPVIRPNTAKTYENMIENHIVPAIGGVKLKRLTAIQIQKMYNDSKTSGRVQRFEKKTDTALSGSTVRRIHMVLSSALKQAVKERIISYNPCDNCRIPPKEKKEMTILPPEKLGAYLREAEQYGVLPMFFLELLLCRTAKIKWRILLPAVLLAVPGLWFVASAEWYAMAWLLVGWWCVAPVLGCLAAWVIWAISRRVARPNPI